MLTRSLLVLEIVLEIASTINGYTTNPYFICQSQDSNESYTVTMSQYEEIVIKNCTRSRINEIITRLKETTLRDRPIRIHMSITKLDEIFLENVTNLDLSGNKLAAVHLRNFTRLQKLNLTSNRISSLNAVKLSPDVSLISLDVSRNRLLQLEQSSILPTKCLFLTSNNIFNLDKNLTLPPSLQLLDLTRNEIENLSIVSIRSDNLVTLNLSINLISAVSRITFEHLPALESLILECNKIFEIEPRTFSKNAKLIELNLRDNNLSALKKGVFDELVNLQMLDISKNDLLKLAPDAVQNLNLIDFSVSENAKLCDAECKQDMEFLLVLGGRLRALKMDRLRLRRFPVMLTTSVRHLDLSENELDAVQLGSLENFPFLQSLTLSGNNIETTENDVFSRMEFLEVLCLDNNKLKRIPLILPPSLTVLQFHRNQITIIGKNDFNGLINLKTLKLNANSIEIIESSSFRFLISLEILDISDNPLKILSTDAFEGPKKLQFLHAANLPLVQVNVTDVRYFPISELPNLRSLNLSRSPELVKSFLTDLPLLATIKQLEILDLSYANLTQVPKSLENFLPHLQTFRTIGNPLDCTKNWRLEWRQTYTTDPTEWTDGDRGLTVQISQTEVEPFNNNNIYEESACPMFENISKIIPEEVFWADIKMNILNSQHDIKHKNSTIYSDNKNGWSKSMSPLKSVLTTNNVSNMRFKLKRKKLSSRSLPEGKIGQDVSNEASVSITKIENETLNIVSKHSSIDEKLILHDNSSTPTSFLINNKIKNTSIANFKKGLDTSMGIDDTLKAESLIVKLGNGLNTDLKSSFSKLSREQHKEQNSSKWNNTADPVSFFDWFPSYNETFESIEQRGTIEDRIEYTHPGVVIFSAITCFLSVIFLTLIAPSCVQKYKWNRHRYDNAEFEDDYTQNIEISSVSAFVETELSLD